MFDWVVPREWNVRDAWIEAPDGRRLARFRDSSLNLLGYSAAVDVTLSRDELLEHVFTDPEHPDRVPYRTSYWSERWGFCMTQREADSLPEGEYRAVIDATLEDGSLTYGEVRLDGSSPSTVLLTTTVCHPALANDNLSGIVVLAALARALAGRSLRHSYRLVWSPGTLGPLCWLHHNRGIVDDIVHGLAISCVGDRGHITYKRSRRGDDGNRPRGGGRPPRHARRSDRRLVAVRRRRAPVLLPRLRPTVRSVLALTGGRVPRVPLLRRRPFRRHARGTR